MGSADWLDMDSFLLATSSMIGSIAYYVSGTENKAITNLQSVQEAKIGRSLLAMVTNSEGNTVPYIAVRGSVKELGSQILTSETGLKGVIQMFFVKEHSVRRYSTGFWGDAVREIAQTVKEVPFGLRSMTNPLLVVQISDPSRAEQLNLLTAVSTQFTPATRGLASTVFGFFSGTAPTGIETTEKMLALDTNVTAIGQLTLQSGKLLLSPPNDTDAFPYILSTNSLEQIIEGMTRRRRGYRIIAYIFFSVTAVVAFRKGWKLWKAYQEKQMRAKILRERAERTMANSDPTRDSNRDDVNPEQHLCIICLTNPREVILFPCGHVCLCLDCLERMDRKCPVCRVVFSSTHQAYIS